MLKKITEWKTPCGVHRGASAMCRQWHKLKLETNLVASLISREFCLRSALLSTLQLYKVILALIIFCGFWKLWTYISTRKKNIIYVPIYVCIYLSRTVDLTEEDSGIFVSKSFHWYFLILQPKKSSLNPFLWKDGTKIISHAGLMGYVVEINRSKSFRSPIQRTA